MRSRPSTVYSIQVLQTRPEVVTDALRTAILEGRLAPGQRLVQEQLADEMQVSRTPLREAFRALEAEGLLVSQAYHGVMVAGLSIENLEGVYALRLVCEGLAARLAARRAGEPWLSAARGLENASRLEAAGRHLTVHRLNRRFHMELAGRAACSELLATVARHWNICENYRRRFLFPLRGVSGTEAIAYHKRIHAAVTEGRPDDAERLMREHLVRSARALIESIQPGYRADLLAATAPEVVA
jgi:DNA-binding GntR family transcriptional regulator